MAKPIVYERRDKAQLRNVAPVYVEASNSTLAHAAAISLYRMMQIPVRFVSVREYHPWEDPDLLRMGFVRPIQAPSIEPPQGKPPERPATHQPRRKSMTKAKDQRTLMFGDFDGLFGVMHERAQEIGAAPALEIGAPANESAADSDLPLSDRLARIRANPTLRVGIRMTASAEPTTRPQYFGALVDEAGAVLDPNFAVDAEGFETAAEVEEILKLEGHSEIEPGIWQGPDGARYKIVSYTV